MPSPILSRAKKLIVPSHVRCPQLVHSTALVIFITALYFKVIGHDFLINWDDVDYITQNPLIRDISIANLKQIFFTPYNGNFAPLHILSYMIDYKIWGMNPAAFKLVNVVLHTMSSLLFYQLLRRLGLTNNQAFIAALIFAIHPVQVESIAWASQRKNTLALLFFLAAWFSWDIWNRDGGQHKHTWYILSLVSFTLALCSKSVALILPFILVAQDFTLNGKKITLRTMQWLAPYLLLLGSFIALTIIAHDSPGGGTTPYHGGSFAITAMNMLPVFLRYLALLFMPTNLTIIYNAPLKMVPDFIIYASGLALLLFILGWLWLSKHNPRYFFWLTIFIVGLLPVANIIPIATLMNDRYLYFPMLGIAPAAVLAGEHVCKMFKKSETIVTTTLALIVVLALSLITWKQIDVWKNSLMLWEDAFLKAPPGTWYEKSTNTNFVKEGYIESLLVEATRLKNAGKLFDAQQLCLTALSLEPANYNALGLIAEIYLQQYKPLEARPYLLRLVKNFPGSDSAHFYLGQSYAMTSEYENAIRQFEIVIKIDPLHQRALQSLKELGNSPIPH